MSSQSPPVAFIFHLFIAAPAAASALPWPAEEQFPTRSLRAHEPRSTTSATKTSMPGWQIAVIALGLFFGVMALGMVGGALEVLLHTRKKVADPDPAPSDLDFGATEAENGGEKEVKGGEDTQDDDDEATAVEGSADSGDEKAEQKGDRFSWQDSQGVQFEVWNEENAGNEDHQPSSEASREMEQDASHDPAYEAHDGVSAVGYPQQPEPAYVGAHYDADHEDEQHYPSYQQEDVSAYAQGHEGQYGQPEASNYHQQHDGASESHNSHGHNTTEAHDEVQDLHGQRMTRFEPWLPQVDEEFEDVPLPEHGSQSETTHQQHPVNFI